MHVRRVHCINVSDRFYFQPISVYPFSADRRGGGVRQNEIFHQKVVHSAVKSAQVFRVDYLPMIYRGTKPRSEVIYIYTLPLLL